MTQQTGKPMNFIPDAGLEAYCELVQIWYTDTILSDKAVIAFAATLFFEEAGMMAAGALPSDF